MEIKTRVKEMRQHESEKEHPVHTEEKGGKAPQSVWALEDKPPAPCSRQDSNTFHKCLPPTYLSTPLYLINATDMLHPVQTLCFRMRPNTLTPQLTRRHDTMLRHTGYLLLSTGQPEPCVGYSTRPTAVWKHFSHSAALIFF